MLLVHVGPGMTNAVTGVLTLGLAGATSTPGASGAPASAVDLLPSGQDVSETVVELAGWVVATGDSEGFPFAIIDKDAAQVLVFDGDGRLRGAAPGLFGSAANGTHMVEFVHPEDHAARGRHHEFGLLGSVLLDRQRTALAAVLGGTGGLTHTTMAPRRPTHCTSVHHWRTARLSSTKSGKRRLIIRMPRSS